MILLHQGIIQKLKTDLQSYSNEMNQKIYDYEFTKYISLRLTKRKVFSIRRLLFNEVHKEVYNDTH